jgi:membrane-bound metal-dependent hydrolase YbcI (DUF457 family)
MLIEHLFYTAGIAVLVGMACSRIMGRDPFWIIMLGAYAPDVDAIGDPALRQVFGITPLYDLPFHHGDFHNVVGLVIFALLAAYTLHQFGFRFTDAFAFAGLGYGLHILEDALLPPAYLLLWPFSSKRIGFSVFEGTRDFFGIANSETLVIGVLLLVGAIVLRTAYEGPGWIRKCLPNPDAEK